MLGLSVDEGSDVGVDPEEVVRCELGPEDDADVVLSVVFKICFRKESLRTVCRRSHCRSRLLSVIAPAVACRSADNVRQWTVIAITLEHEHRIADGQR
jgi:hypothetical protein